MCVLAPGTSADRSGRRGFPCGRRVPRLVADAERPAHRKSRHGPDARSTRGPRSPRAPAQPSHPCEPIMKRILLVLLVALGGLPACKDSTAPGGPLTAITVSPSPLYLGVGDTMTLSAIGTHDDGTTAPATATFSSSNNSVVTVSSSGLARGVSEGTAQITVKSGG